MEGIARQKSRWRHAVERGRGRNQHHIGTIVCAVLANTPQGRQALADQVLVRGKAVVGQGFPVGEEHTAQAGCEKRQLFQQTLGIGGIGSDNGRALPRSFVAQGQLGQQSGIGAGNGAGQGITLTRGEFGDIHSGKYKAVRPSA